MLSNMVGNGNDATGCLPAVVKVSINNGIALKTEILQCSMDPTAKEYEA